MKRWRRGWRSAASRARVRARRLHRKRRCAGIMIASSNGWKAARERRGLKLTKVHELLTREGVDVSYSSVYRYAAAHFGWARPKLTLRRAEVSPGELAEVDFGQLGKIYDPESDRNRLIWASLVTLGFSRHQYVHVSFSQKLDVVIDGLEEAWEFFGGVPLRVVVDNMKTAVVKSDRYEPIFQRSTEQYAEHRGFVIDPAVARHPTGKPIVERGVQYVRESFFRGEQWLDLAHVQREARRWCMEVAGRRIHGTTQKRPLVVFEQVELACLRPVKGPRFDTPQWATPTVHDDHHVKFLKALYSVPTQLCGKASHGPRRQSARTHLLQKRAHQNPPQKTSRRKSDRLHRLSPRARGLRQARPGAYGAPSQETRQQHRPFHEPAPQRRSFHGPSSDRLRSSCAWPTSTAIAWTFCIYRRRKHIGESPPPGYHADFPRFSRCSRMAAFTCVASP